MIDVEEDMCREEKQCRLDRSEEYGGWVSGGANMENLFVWEQGV